MSETKECYKCELPFTKESMTGWGSNWNSHRYCKVCEMYRTIERDYGITREQWDELYRLGDSRCWICLKPIGKPSYLCKKDYVTDHDHVTGKVRGLLCYSCNSILKVVDSIKFFEGTYSLEKLKEAGSFFKDKKNKKRIGTYIKWIKYYDKIEEYLKGE